MSKHTPTPWRPGRYGDLMGANGTKVRVYGLSVSHVMSSPQQEERDNAAIMIKAVNAFDPLLDYVRRCASNCAEANELLKRIEGTQP